MIRKIAALVFLFSSPLIVSAQAVSHEPTEPRPRALLKQMTLDERVDESSRLASRHAFRSSFSAFNRRFGSNKVSLDGRRKLGRLYRADFGARINSSIGYPRIPVFHEWCHTNLTKAMRSHRPPKNTPITTTAQSTTPTKPTGLKNSSSAVFLRSFLQSLAPQCSQKSAV